MKCPNCETELLISQDTRCYETSEEHISDPNGTSPERKYLYCPEVSCCLKDGAAFWDFDGEIFTTNRETTEWCIDNHVSY